jgi:hypothetical protein
LPIWTPSQDQDEFEVSLLAEAIAPGSSTLRKAPLLRAMTKESSATVMRTNERVINAVLVDLQR